MQALLMQKIRNWLKNSQRGAAMVLFAILLPFLLGIMGLAIDLSLVYAERAKLQDIADAAALAGGAHLKDSSLGNVDPIKQAVEASVNYNGLKPEGGVGTLAGSIELADNQNLVVTAGKAYAGNKVDDAVPQAAADGTISTLDRVRVRIAKRVPTFFLNIFSDKYKNGFPVQVAAAATGGSEPAGFKIVGKKGVYVNYTNFAHTSLQNKDLTVNRTNPGEPDKYTDGSIYAGPFIRVSSSMDTTDSNNVKDYQYQSASGLKFVNYGANTLSVNGDIFAERYGRGAPTSDDNINIDSYNGDLTTYYDDYYARYRYLIHPVAEDPWEYLPLVNLTNGRSSSAGDFVEATSSVNAQGKKYLKELKKAKEDFVEDIKQISGSNSINTVDAALEWMKNAKNNNNDKAKLLASKWRYVSEGNNNFDLETTKGSMATYNVVMDVRDYNYVTMSCKGLYGVYVDKLLAIGYPEQDDLTGIDRNKTCDISTRGWVINKIYADCRLSFSNNGNDDGAISVSTKISDGIRKNSTIAAFMSQYLSDKSKKDYNDYFDDNEIPKVKNFFIGTIYSEGDIVFAKRDAMGHFFGKDAIVFAEDSAFFGYTVMKDGTISTNKYDETALTAPPMCTKAETGKVPYFDGGNTTTPAGFLDYSDFVLYKDPNASADKLNTSDNLFNASMSVYQVEGGPLLPCAVVNGVICKPDYLKFKIDGKEYTLDVKNGQYRVDSEDKKKTYSIDLNDYKTATSDNNRIKVVDKQTGKITYEPGQILSEGGRIQGYFTANVGDENHIEYKEMMFDGNRMCTLNRDETVEKKYAPWWERGDYAPSGCSAYYDYSNPTKFMRYNEKREDYFKNYADYLTASIDWTDSTAKFWSYGGTFRKYFGDLNRPIASSFDYHEWEKGEPRSGGKLALVE